MDIQASFITSSKTKEQFIVSNKPIIAICGKSNVGKSTLINMLANRKKLAKTSDTPGRTRLINYFDFGEFILADLPGYGFAKVSKEEKLSWAKTMDDFFNFTKITHVFSLIDVRHNPTEDDIDMINYLHDTLTPFSVIATKCDKLSKTKIKPQIKVLSQKLCMGEGNILGVSQDGFGKDELIRKISKIIEISKQESTTE